ncbi:MULTISPECIES: MFS transporter [unclassified Variovorax]|uniref:MFS transporter n=1 Tax=unclassified Variovorax TaxID=663243 RepID=UPI0025750A58|nr:MULTISPECIES: MFS transporter [unclassified Variovorax]MDM0088237.1 MFS transporter [Variovorax sp. J22G40]MDM0146310.1 MFS transporter [Variovorax sp. J2P1-31]
MTSEDALYKRVTLRLVPFLVLLYLVAYIDRSVLAFAKLQMNVDVGISDAAYGLGAGLFFLGYIVFEIPSNLILTRVGARKWFARILFTWGCITAAMALIQSPTSFYWFRFLLGAAEAGFYPGVLYYLTLWYPAQRRGKIYGLFAFAQPLAPMLAGPLAGALLGMNGLGGLQGWQWVFIVCGVPAVLLVIPTLKLLPDTPSDAKWLTKEEAEILNREVKQDADRIRSKEASHSLLGTLKDARVLMLAFAYVPIPLAIYGLSLWLPTLIKGFAVTDLTTGFLSAVPFLFGVIGLLVIPRSSDKRNERHFHIVGCSLVGILGLLGAAFFSSLAMQLFCLCFVGFSLYSASAVLWTLPGRFLTGAGAAAGLAAINSIGNLGGYLGPFGIGLIKERTGSLAYGLVYMAGGMLLTIVLVLILRMKERAESPSPLACASAR